MKYTHLTVIIIRLWFICVVKKLAMSFRLSCLFVCLSPIRTGGGGGLLHRPFGPHLLLITNFVVSFQISPNVAVVLFLSLSVRCIVNKLEIAMSVSGVMCLVQD